MSSFRKTSLISLALGVFGTIVYQVRLQAHESDEKEFVKDSKSSSTLSTGFSNMSIERARFIMQDFADARDWKQFHTPRNVLLALTGEIGEVSEIFQWNGYVAPGCPNFTSKQRIHLGEELSDVTLYTVRLADRCQIDLSQALRKHLHLPLSLPPQQPNTSSSSTKDSGFEPSLTFKQVLEALPAHPRADFGGKYAPRDILCTLISSVGSVSHCFIDSGEVTEGLPEWNTEADGVTLCPVEQVTQKRADLSNLLAVYSI